MAVPGQMVGKGWATALPALLVLLGRIRRTWAAGARRVLHGWVTG
ncbi:hypothetical protein ACH4FX_38215 [Streptomyces sp. NPDC018019]